MSAVVLFSGVQSHDLVRWGPTQSVHVQILVPGHDPCQENPVRTQAKSQVKSRSPDSGSGQCSLKPMFALDEVDF